MLPDYPKVKRKIGKLLLHHMREEILRRSPVLRQIQTVRQHEGDTGSQGEVGGRKNIMEYKKIEAGMTLHRAELRCGDFGRILAKVGDMAETFAEAQSKALFATVSDAAESVGNVVKANGPFTKEAFLEMTSKIQTEFNPATGEPHHPSIVVHPDTWQAIRDDVEGWEDDDEFKAAVAEIENTQRLAWRDRESRRRLVD